MALKTAAISANGSKGHHKFTLNIVENSIDQKKNTSSVSWNFVLSPLSTGYNWVYSSTVPVWYSLTINGETYTGNIMSYDGRSTVTIRSGTMTITHDTNGKKTIYFSLGVASLDVSYLTGSANKGGEMSLTDISREAKLTSAPNFSDGNNPTITYSNPMGNSVDSLQACISFDHSNDDIPYRDVPKTGTSYTFDLTPEEREILRNETSNSNSIEVHFFIRTEINGDYFYSYLTRTFTVDDANPIITASVIDVNSTTVDLTGDNTKLIKYYSNAEATMSAEAQKGAAIDESLYIIRNGDNTGYGTEHTFESVDYNEFIFSAEDSRGNVGTAYIAPEMIPYIKLTCNIANNRPDALGNMSVVCTGNYFNGDFGAVSNTLTVQYRYYATGQTFSDWANMTVTKNGNSYVATANFVIPDFNQELYYTFETRAIDKLATIPSTAASVKSIPVFHWGENDFVFEVPVTFKAGTTGGGGSSVGDEVDGDLRVTGNLRLKGDGNYGNTLFFGDGSYCYITEPEDDVMHIKASRIDLNANAVYVSGNPIYATDRGRWSPSLNSSAISYYTTQEGWYSKIGQFTTVSFYIKATCNSGYTGTSIQISGMPFTPMWAAAGGGMCSGTCISANHNFQCFVAETSGIITTRVQACNNTTATNLNTSATGCCYRSGGGEITLSGTIMFMANS